MKYSVAFKQLGAGLDGFLLNSDRTIGENKWFNLRQDRKARCRTGPTTYIWVFPNIGVPQEWMVYNGKPY